MGRAALVAAIGLACFSLAGFAPLAGVSAPVVAVLGALSVVAYTGLIGVSRRLVVVVAPALGLLALVPASISLAVVLH
jgi:hypothetical protein